MKQTITQLDASVSIALPLPPQKCSPNGRGKHWGAKARAVKSYRQACGLILRHFWQGRAPIVGKVRIDLDFYLCKGWHAEGLYFPRDPDNAVASIKSALDGLRDSGIIQGDTSRYVEIGEVRLHTKRPEHENRTELLLTLRDEASR